MKPFEFIIIFIFIIFGLAISEVIVSLANILRYYEQVVFYLPPFLWAMSGWLFALNYFFSLYKLERIKAWNITNFGNLIFSTIMFVTCTFLVWPGDFNGQSLNLTTYFRHNSFFIYLTTIALVLSLAMEARFIHKSKNIMVYVFHGLSILILALGCIYNTKSMDYLIGLCMLLVQIFLTWRSPKIITQQGETT
jgi:hypothetical protein